MKINIGREIALCQIVIASLENKPGERTAWDERQIYRYKERLFQLTRNIRSVGPRRVKLPGIPVERESAP